MDSKEVLKVLEGVISRPCCSVVWCDENCPVERIWPLVKALREEGLSTWVQDLEMQWEADDEQDKAQHSLSRPTI